MPRVTLCDYQRPAGGGQTHMWRPRQVTNLSGHVVAHTYVCERCGATGFAA